MEDTIELSCMCCANCKVLFWVSEGHKDRLRSDKKSFYCPNGHSQSFVGKKDSEIIDELRTELQKTRNAKYISEYKLKKEISALEKKAKPKKTKKTKKSKEK